MPTETISLDRKSVIDLLVETHAVSDVLEALAGTAPLRITHGLSVAEGRVAEQVYGGDDSTIDLLLSAADARAREIVSWLAEPRAGVDAR